jgi:hypothetical protein
MEELKVSRPAPGMAYLLSHTGRETRSSKNKRSRPKH